MTENIFYRVDPFWVCLILICMLVAASEAGYWLVNYRAKRKPETFGKEDLALILGAVLTLLSLLLGFTYSMSEGRFETRRELVVQEANAIGTTYLRAQTLQEPRSSEAQELLRQYVNLRVELAGTNEITPDAVRETDSGAKKMHNLLWTQAVALAKESPNPVSSLYLQTLNEMIDLHAKRLAAYQNRVPLAIYLVLCGVSIIVVFLMGFYIGFSKHRAHFLTMMLAILVASVMWLILDLDQPTRGGIRTSQQSLIDLQQDLNPISPNDKNGRFFRNSKTEKEGQ